MAQNDEIDAGSVESYIKSLLAKVDVIAAARATHPHVAEVLTDGRLDEARRVIEALNENPWGRFPAMFFYLFRSSRRLAAIERAMAAAKPRMSATSWNELVNDLGSQNPTGAVGELAVFIAAHDGGLRPQWHPRAPTGKRPDLLVTVRGRAVYLEVSVLAQSAPLNALDRAAELAGGVASGSVPSFEGQSERVDGKIEEKLKQVVPDSPNVLALIFTSFSEDEQGRAWGFERAFDGKAVEALDSGRVIDRINRHHLDCVLAFDYTKPTVQMSPSYPHTRLTDDERLALVAALNPLPFWFPGSLRDEDES